MGIISNPILPGFNPDSSITHIPDFGYVICTSSFEFWPALPIYHSVDLVSWNVISHALNRREQGLDLRNLESSAGLWAPCIRYHKGKVYVACTSVNRFLPPFAMGEVYMSRSFYVWTEDITNDAAWSMPVYVDEPGIDPDLFFDDNGKVYLTTSRRIRHSDTSLPFDIGLYLTEIDLETGRSLTPSVLIRSAGAGESSGTVEGSHIHKHDGLYYLFAAQGGTEVGHCATVSRSASVRGPYEEPPQGVNPIVHNGDHPDVQGTGHMDIAPIVGTDTWLAVFLGTRPTRAGSKERPEFSTSGHIGRETFAAGMIWTREGWPRVNHGRRIELVDQYENVPTTDRVIRDWEDEFDGSALDRRWYTIRTPLKPFWSLSPSDGISLYGNVHRLDGYQENPACLLVRQMDKIFDFSATLDGLDDRENTSQEAGVVLWMSKASHASLAIRLTLNQAGEHVRELVFRKRKAAGIADKILLEGFDREGASDAEMRRKIGQFADFSPFEETVVPLGNSKDAFNFLIKGSATAYEFGYKTPGQETPAFIGELAVQGLNPIFTGAHLGIFAQGYDGRPVLGPANFTSVDYKAFA